MIIYISLFLGRLFLVVLPSNQVAYAYFHQWLKTAFPESGVE